MVLVDTVPVTDKVHTERLSPGQLRETQQGEKKIEVVQKRKVVLPARPQRRVIKPSR